LFWYGLVPVAGALVSRRHWRRFRACFDRLRLAPLLDYARYTAGGGAQGGRVETLGDGTQAAGQRRFRFTGAFESITDGHTLWVQGPDLTIPVALAGAQIYTLPAAEGRPGRESFDPAEEAPQRLRWDRVATLTEEARVYVGGSLTLRENRWVFAAVPDSPLQVIFYTGSDRSMAIQAVRSGRHQNEYWNAVTPYALALGALCLIAMAAAFLPRPAFRLTAITAFAAAFIPLYPLVPPGLLLAISYRRLWWQARLFRACRDLARLPLLYPGGRLPGGERYGARRCGERPEGFPLLAPGMRKPRKESWYLFGALDSEGGVPREPEDSFAPFGAIPGDPEKLARRCARNAYLLEILSWLLLMGGIGLNAFFIALIITLL
jgi:hypothetical protein